MSKNFLKKISDRLIRFISPLHLFTIFLLLASCARHNPIKEQTLPEALAKLHSCAPADKADENLKLTIERVTLLPDETNVRIVAQAQTATINFDLPTYSLSRGRWLIDGKARAYLLDEKCREYKLKDRRPSSGWTIPQNGRIKLNPGQSFEAILVFPSLLEPTRVLMLIYGGRSLYFSLRDAENGVATGTEKQSQ